MLVPKPSTSIRDSPFVFGEHLFFSGCNRESVVQEIRDYQASCPSNIRLNKQEEFFELANGYVYAIVSFELVDSESQSE